MKTLVRQEQPQTKQSHQVAQAVPDGPIESVENSLSPKSTSEKNCPCDGACPKCVPIQAKLRVGHDNDVYEKEADKVAEQVAADHTKQPAPAAQQIQTITSMPTVQTTTSVPADNEEKQEDESAEVVQPKSKSFAPSPPDDLENQIQNRCSSGSALPDHLRENMETKFNCNFNSVRIHTSSTANKLTDQVNAYAFTSGKDIYFSNNTYNPNTASGKKLIAHELTHVIQQSGTKPGKLVQRYEKKPYTGSAVHKRVEGILEKSNSNLITEATIPGATRNSEDLQKVGFADLYKSTGKKVPSIKIQIKDPSLNEAYHERAYKSANSSKTHSAKGFTRSPRMSGSKVKGEFPQNFWVGDLKPLWLPAIGGGFAQLSYYKSGMPNFARQAQKDGKVKNGTIRGADYTGITIPAGIDYSQFDTQHSSTGPGNWIVSGKKTRYWIYEMPNSGLYIYFTMPHPFDPGTDHVYVTHVEKKLDEVRKDLVDTKQGKISGSIHLQGKFRQIKARNNRMVLIQRTKVKKNWTALGKAWERKRAAWDRTEGKAFIKKYEKSVGKRIKVNKKLKKPIGPTTPFGKVSKSYKKIAMWQGKTGKLFGWLRFKFGKAFDKIAGLFEKIKARFKGFNKKINGSYDSKPMFGWKRKLLYYVFKGVKVGLRQIMTVAFQSFAACINGIVSKIINQFTQELNEKLLKSLEGVKKRIDKFTGGFFTSFLARMKKWTSWFNKMINFATWVSRFGTIVNLIRAGVQIISCLAPPALGCLWGLVVNVGIEAGLNLLIGTQWFNNKIVNPFIRKILGYTVLPPMFKLLKKALQKIKLDDYMTGIRACTPPGFSFAGPGGGGKGGGGILQFGGKTGSALLAKRNQWDKDNKSLFMSDLQKMFKNADGSPMTEKQMKELLKAMDGLEPCKQSDRAKIQKALNAAKDAKGAIDPAKAIARIKKKAAAEKAAQDQDASKSTPKSGAGSMDDQIEKVVKAPKIKVGGDGSSELTKAELRKKARYAKKMLNGSYVRNNIRKYPQLFLYSTKVTQLKVGARIPGFVVFKYKGKVYGGSASALVSAKTDDTFTIRVRTQVHIFDKYGNYYNKTTEIIEIKNFQTIE